MDYLREPDAIYRRSFAEIAGLDGIASVPVAIRPLAIRLVHACGMPDIVDDLRYSEDLPNAVRAALDGGAHVYCDVDTLRHGIMAHLLPADCRVHCAIAAQEVADHARSRAMTRAASQIDHWHAQLDGQILVIGNAPTALFRLLERIDAGERGRPAAVLAFPVGFVGAAESKAELARNPRGMAFATLMGRRGGTGMAQAAINALAGGLER